MSKWLLTILASLVIAIGVGLSFSLIYRPELAKQASVLERRAAELDARELERLKAELKQLEEERQRLLAELEPSTIAAELKQLMEEHQRSEAELERLKAELKQLGEERQRSEAELERLKAELKQLEEERQRSEAELKQLRPPPSFASKSAKLKQLEEERQRSEAELKKQLRAPSSAGKFAELAQQVEEYERSEAELKRLKAELKQLEEVRQRSEAELKKQLRAPSSAAKTAKLKQLEEERQRSDAELERLKAALKQLEKERPLLLQHIEIIEKAAPDQTGARPAAIHETVYASFAWFGMEKEGYGLYSYVLFPHASARARAFAETLFATTGAAAESLIAPENINILYLPTHKLEASLPSRRAAGGPEALANLVVDKVYNYALARALMAMICEAPAESVADLCAGDLSRGPYLFTYARPPSIHPVPPPYLFVDLSLVHERAFSEFIAAYKAQVKRTDYTDRERIETFRLTLLSIVLTAADWVAPAGTAVADILHMADTP